VDYDRDGRLDLIVARYLERDFAMNMWCGLHKPGYRRYCHPDQFKPIAHLAFHNNGDGTFTDVSRASEIGFSPGKGLGVAINDFDLDEWPDILIANASFPQQLFRNNRDGTFTEIGLKVGLAYDEDGALVVLDRCAKIRAHKTHGSAGGKRCQFAAIEMPGNIQRDQHEFGAALGFKRQYEERQAGVKFPESGQKWKSR
jgi:hypothetical protein